MLSPEPKRGHDLITVMRKILPPALSLALLLAISACGAPMHWAKSGADEAALKRDMLACRADAREEAAHYYRPYSGALTDQRYWLVWGDQPDFDRFMREDSLMRACMQNKGYAWVTASQQA